jgi:hypothetical protein
MEAAAKIKALIEQELLRFTDPTQREKVRALLVAPRCEERGWDYGEIGQTYPCWIVAEHPQSNTAFAYCEQGFGPENPWGLLFLSLSSPYTSMGMDSGWFPHFDECFRESFAAISAEPDVRP